MLDNANSQVKAKIDINIKESLHTVALEITNQFYPGILISTKLFKQHF